jgi:adenylate kinase family enzyme
VQRVSIVGNTGCGKTTLAARLARLLDAPHIELDALRHGPGWKALPDAELARVVAERVTEPRWVVDGNYACVRHLVWANADAIVWLDRPRHVVMRRLAKRTLRRALFRVELWNGNRERWQNFFSLDPERSVLAWAWTRHVAYRDSYAAAEREAEIPFYRLRTDSDVERFFEALSRAGAPLRRAHS